MSCDSWQLRCGLAAFGINGIGHGMKRSFMTHPPLEERIAALSAANRMN